MEDARTRDFFFRLLERLGFNVGRKIRFLAAPAGRGSGEQWVLKQYPPQVKFLRSRNYQRRCLVAVRDGDATGTAARKAQLDQALADDGQAGRGGSEAIATPVPTWSIENWLLALLDENEVDESRYPPDSTTETWKQRFERLFAGDERATLKRAAEAYCQPAQAPELPSLSDGRQELARID